MAREFRHKGASIKLGGGLARYIGRLHRTLTPAVLDAIEAEGEKLLHQAREQWPVKTGRSKRALKLRTANEKEAAGIVVIYNETNYTRFIRQAGYAERRTWIRLVEAPARAAAPTVLGAAFAAALGVFRGR